MTTDSTAQRTGVDWCELTVSDELLELVEKGRANEARLCGMLPASRQEQLVREIVTSEVSTASVLTANPHIDTDALLAQCLSMRGRPWDEARARRDMRERIHLYRRILRCGATVPSSLEGLLDLWSEAMDGEVALYKEAEIPQYRSARIPFGHGGGPFEAAAPPLGRETVDASRVPIETQSLLAFMGQANLPTEIKAGATHFLCGHIHPFNDGNGHAARMLSCILLADDYSPATILSLLRRLQGDRGTMNLAMMDTVRERADLEAVVLLFLEMLRAAQRDLFPRREGFASLPLRLVRTGCLELISARRPHREVYRTDDGVIVKAVADSGRLSRASAIYEAISAACEVGAAVTRPLELVRTERDYALLLERVNGQQLNELVIHGQTTPEYAGQTLAQCLHDLHALQGDATRMRDVRKPFLGMVDTIAPMLSEDTANACRQVIGDIPAATTLVHGDVHMGNVMIDKEGKTVLIDADTISMGQPVFDLACTRNALQCWAVIDKDRAQSFHGVPIESAQAIWRSLFDSYYAGANERRVREADALTELLAWIVLLSQLMTTAPDGSSFGESIMRKLHAAGCLSKALGKVQEQDIGRA